MMTVNWKVIIVTWIFLLVVYVKISKVFSHFIEVLFHLLFIIISRNVLRRLVNILSCLPSEIRTFRWKLTKLLSEILSFIFFWIKTSMISFWSLRWFKEILLWSGGLNVHFISHTWWHIYWLITVRCLLLGYKIVGSGRRVVSPVTLF